MKKLLCLLLVVAVLVASFGILTACKINDVPPSPKPEVTEAKFAVISDIHIINPTLFTESNYVNYLEEDKMVGIGAAILSSAVDDILADATIEAVLIPGDLTESGETVLHEAVPPILKRLTDGGKKVFVINGNHDNREGHKGSVEEAKATLEDNTYLTADELRANYADFGYGSAIAKDTASLSYVVDINATTRLIAIDNCNYYSTDRNAMKDAIDDNLIYWVETQVKAAETESKTVIAMCHIPLTTHYPSVSAAFTKEDNVENSAAARKLASALADNKCSYLFTGHQHNFDAKEYWTTEKSTVYDEESGTNKTVYENKNVLYDIETGASVYVGSAYRTVEITDQSVKVKTIAIDTVDEEYLPDIMPDDEKAEIAKGLKSYSKFHLTRQIDNVISGLTGTNGILARLKDDDSDLDKVLNILQAGALDKLAAAPFYKADEMEGGLPSLERICEGFGVTLPQSSVKNMTELIVFGIGNMMHGDENLAGSAEFTVLKYAVLSLFYYIDCCSGEIATALPDAVVIDIDAERLFKTGELECYVSNFIPFVMELVGDLLSSTVMKLLGGINESLAALKSPLVGGALAGLTSGVISDLSPYVDATAKLLFVGKLVDVGVLTEWAGDFVTDTAPADKNFVIDRNKADKSRNN